MAHVQITYSGDGAQVLVDGVDITKSVLAEGFAIEFLDEPHRGLVSMQLRADRLDVDLPDALINALAAESTPAATPSEED